MSNRYVLEIRREDLDKIYKELYLLLGLKIENLCLLKPLTIESYDPINGKYIIINILTNENEM